MASRISWTWLVALAFALMGCEDEVAPPSDPVLEVEWVGCIEPDSPWTTCAEFCEWDGAVCFEGGCDGATVRSNLAEPWPNWWSCAETTAVPLPNGCDDPLVFDFPRTFDCCCDYR